MLSRKRFAVMTIFGTRPEAIKMAPIVLAMRETDDLVPVVVVTGQHRSMLDGVMSFFGIRPDVDLNIIRDRQSLSDVTVRALSGLDQVIAGRQPDLVMVQGDTTSTVAGALAAFYQRVPVAHLEAGLRTGDPYAPFPEEINRRITTRLARLHLAATPASVGNLLADGVARDDIVCTGNSVIDALYYALQRGGPFEDPALRELDSSERPMLLVTAHRRESWGEPMRRIGTAVASLARREPDLRIVFSLHRNPVVRDTILPLLREAGNVTLVEPTGYSSFCRLMSRSHVILTDSGGVQEEAPSIGKPVLVMRETTERPEAVAAGTARLVGTDTGQIIASVQELLHDRDAYDRMARAVNPYGDGQAAGRAVGAVRHFLAGSPVPEEFLATQVPADVRPMQVPA